MAAQTLLKIKGKAGAFTGGQLAAREIGMDTSGEALYGSSNGSTVFSIGGGGISNVSEDSTPELGGNLDVAGNSIISTTAGNIPITPDTTGRTQITNLTVQGGDVVFNETTNDLTLAVTDQTVGAPTVTIPDLAGTSGDVVISNATQTLTNKTLTAPVISTISNTGTVTLFTATDTVVGKDTTDTLTNKTISASTNTIDCGTL